MKEVSWEGGTLNCKAQVWATSICRCENFSSFGAKMRSPTTDCLFCTLTHDLLCNFAEDCQV